jgi:hypothetical protein
MTGKRLILFVTLLFVFLLFSGLAAAQTQSAAPKTAAAEPVSSLEHNFFAAIRDGNADKFLSYVSERGFNFGPQARPMSRDEAQKQLLAHRGLYCKLFDSSCIDAPIKLDASAPPCSYRELLTHSEQVHTAATEATRNGVQQAILVARIESKKCPNDKLIDFIFNLNADGWKLFSLP